MIASRPSRVATPETSGNALRPYYSPRQVVTADDLTAGQSYLLEMLRQHNRFLHGFGVVCGLEVLPGSVSSEAGRPTVMVTSGYALSPQGDEIYLPNAERVPIDCMPSPGDECRDETIAPVPPRVYLAVRYLERPICPVPVYRTRCAPTPVCEYTRIQAGFGFACLTELPDIPIVECTEILSEFLRQVPAVNPSPLPSPTSPWVVLAGLDLDADGMPVGIDYAPRARLVSARLLTQALRCLASVAPIGGNTGTRFEIFIDRRGEYRWRLVIPNGEIIATSGEGFVTRAEAERELEQIKLEAASAEIVDRTVPRMALQGVGMVRGIRAAYSARLRAVGIVTLGELAIANPGLVAETLGISAARAAELTRAAQDLIEDLRR
jgi:uncharacterized protein YegP (UPF0339 family)